MKEKPLDEKQMIQKLFKEIASHPTVIRLGFMEIKLMFERQLLISAFERNKEDARATAEELKIHPNLFRYHLRHTMGRFDVSFPYKRKAKDVTIIDLLENAGMIEKKLAASEKLENIQQRKLKF